MYMKSVMYKIIMGTVRFVRPRAITACLWLSRIFSRRTAFPASERGTQRLKSGKPPKYAANWCVAYYQPLLSIRYFQRTAKGKLEMDNSTCGVPAQ